MKLLLVNGSQYTSKYTGNYIDFTYSGDNVIIQKTNTYTYDFICTFNWADYPFDSQTCAMELVLFTPQSDQIKVILLSLSL